MELINFDNFLPFNELRKKMGIKKSDEKRLNFKTTIESFWEEIKRGKEIKKESIKKHEDFTLGIKGSDERIIVYIKEQYFSPEEVDKEYKFHIAWCKTLENMYEGNRYNRYVAVQKDEPEFLVDLINIKNKSDIRKNVTKKMSVCKNCLTKLNYKGYATASSDRKTEIYKNFSLKEFLDTYKKTEIFVVPENDIYNEDSNVYSDNWKEISYYYRSSVAKWKCEKCGKNCSSTPYELHVHHKDGNKRNNMYSNLVALCRECHEEMPYHEHMKK